MYLLDTNVLSELKKAKNNRANPNVMRWANTQSPDDFYTSKIVILELTIGALRKQKSDSAQAQNLKNWINHSVIPSFGEYGKRILAVNDNVLHICANLHAIQPRPQHDALIASTAIAYDLILVTRNLSDFQEMGVKLFNPFAD